MDMLKQFLMHDITEASRRGLGHFQPNCRTAPGDFQIQLGLRSDWFAEISAVEKAVAVVRIYATLDQWPRASSARARSSVLRWHGRIAGPRGDSTFKH